MQFETLQILYLFAIFVGVLFVSISAFWRKMKTGEISGWEEFKFKYVILIIFSIMASVIASFFLYAANPIEVKDPALVFAAGLAAGIGSKRILEEIWKHIDPDWWAS